MSHMCRTPEELDTVLNWAAEGEDQGSHYPGMSYEQGIRDMHDWMMGETNHAPNQE